MFHDGVTVEARRDYRYALGEAVDSRRTPAIGRNRERVLDVNNSDGVVEVAADNGEP